MKTLIEKLNNIDTKSLKFKLWASFLIFSCFILIVLWLLQTVFFQSYYEVVKKGEIIKVANSVISKNDSTDIQYTIDNYAYRYSVNIYIISNNRVIYISDISNKLNSSFQGNISINLNLLKEKEITRIKNDKLNIDMYAYIATDNYSDKVLVTTPVEALDSTVKILTTQLQYITIILILLAGIISIYLSKKLTKPIKDIEIKAKELGNGNYTVKFDTGSYTEIDSLSNTLNKTTEQLSKTDNLRRELISNVSHDLKTPLTMIKSYAEMLIDLPQTKKKREEKLNIIIEETDRLTILVNDIIALSKLESNIDELNIQLVNLSDLINIIIKRFSYLVELDNYKFQTNIVDNLYTKVDKNKISQVIYNLISNAINYTGKDKKVIINLYEKDSKIIFEVKDTGKGIAKQDIEKIWDKYYKVEVNHKRNVVSTGLGLSIVKNVLTKHNLKFGVNSIKNKGTTFYVEFTKENSF